MGLADRINRGRSNGLKGRFNQLIGRVGEFDPNEAAKRSAEAQFETIERPLKENVERLRGEQVGRGRLNTGFGFEDEDRLVRGTFEELARTLGRNALTSSGQQLQAFGLEGDLVSGGLDREQAEKNAKKRRRGGLFGALGAVAGSFLPVPGGTYLGGMLGEALGGL